MKWSNGLHIPDPELIQAVDGELSRRRAARVQAHLTACWQCRSRRGEIEQAISDFMEVRPDLPPIQLPRRLLAMRLSELAQDDRPSFRDRCRQYFWVFRRQAYAVLIVATIVAAGVLIHYKSPVVQAAVTPNSKLTPGAVRTVSVRDVCSAALAGEQSHLPDRLARNVFKNYGILDPKPRTYEVDYLITPALGGSDDIRNLWPEPYAAGVWNAHVKDALEDRLHDLVCEGKLDLATAQHDIASNWIEAYKRYFDSDHPLEYHAGFAKDPPWE